MKLIIHLGYPRTATTLLQKRLFPYHSDINYLGPKSFEKKLNLPLNQNGIDNILNLSDAKKIIDLEKFSRKKINIISSEAYLNYTKINNYKSLIILERYLRSYFKDMQTKVFYTVRNQYDSIFSIYHYVYSEYQEYLGCNDFAEFIKKVQELKEKKKNQKEKNLINFLQTYDFNYTYGLVKSKFPKSKIKILNYSELEKDYKNYFKKLSSFIEIDYDETIALIGKQKESALSQNNGSIYYKKRILNQIIESKIYQNIHQFVPKKLVSLGKDYFFSKVDIKLKTNKDFKTVIENYYYNSNNAFFKKTGIKIHNNKKINKKENLYLVTSANQLSYPKNFKNILLLGEWCNFNLNKDFIKNYNFEILPYHWEKEERKLKDYKYIMSVYKTLSKELSESLNKTHKKNFSTKYWETIISPWLMVFIVSIFDRYLLIKQTQKYNIIGTSSIKVSEQEMIAKSSREFLNFTQHDLWNNYIFSFLISKINSKIKIKKVLDSNKIKTTKINFNLKRNIIKFISYITTLIKNEEKIFIIGSYLKLYQEILLQIKLNHILKFNLEIPYNGNFIISSKLRKKLLKKKGNDEFSLILRELLVKQMPIFYLEGYEAFSKFVKQLKWPKKPKLIFSSNSQINDETFKFWLAEKRENKTPFVGGQHGGGFFISRYATSFDRDVFTSDKFISWGNKKFKNSKIVPLFNIKTASNKFKRFLFCDEINLVQDFPPKYTTALSSTVFPLSYCKQNAQFQYNFIKNLSKENKEKVKVRLGAPNEDLENFESNIWKKIDPKINLESRFTSIKDSIQASKIVICTTLASTTFLECLASNIPCFLLNEYDKNCISKDCRADFENLRKINVLQDNPYHFSKFINKHYENINYWWNSKKTKNVIDSFKDKYSFTDREPLSKLSKVLMQNFKTKSKFI